MLLRLYVRTRVRLWNVEDKLIDQTGATAVEYALMLALIFMAVVTAVAFLGHSTNSEFQKVQFP